MVLRAAILYMLYDASFHGNLFLYIISLLEDREVLNLINSHISECIKAMVGATQGSILALSIFIFFITTMTHIIRKHNTFADDLTTDLREGHAKYMRMINTWCRRLKMRISICMIDVMCISGMTGQQISVLGGQPTQAGDFPKMFGCDFLKRSHIQPTY